MFEASLPGENGQSTGKSLKMHHEIHSILLQGKKGKG